MWSYTFKDGVTITHWDATVIKTQSEEEVEMAFLSRWGKNAFPSGDGLDPVEKLRRFCWAVKADGTIRASIPRCHRHRANNETVPGNMASKYTTHKGDCPADRLPCGCVWEEVAIELFIAHELKLFWGMDNALPNAPIALSEPVRHLVFTFVNALVPGFTVKALFAPQTRIALIRAATDLMAEKGVSFTKAAHIINKPYRAARKFELKRKSEDEDEVNTEAEADGESSVPSKKHKGPSTREKMKASAEARKAAKAAKDAEPKAPKPKVQRLPLKRPRKAKQTKDAATEVSDAGRDEA